jgi:hypothetical protein
MASLRPRALVLSLGLALVLAGFLGRAQYEFDFAITPAFLQSLEAEHTILSRFGVQIDARSDIKDVGAGTATSI